MMNAKAWSIRTENQRSHMTIQIAKKRKKEKEGARERKREMKCYLTVRSHHTVRGRRLRVRRALGTRRTLWHHAK